MICGHWGLPPSEFWRMSPAELFWFIESKIPRDKKQSKDVFDDKWAELAARLD